MKNILLTILLLSTLFVFFSCKTNQEFNIIDLIVTKRIDTSLNFLPDSSFYILKVKYKPYIQDSTIFNYQKVEDYYYHNNDSFPKELIYNQFVHYYARALNIFKHYNLSKYKISRNDSSKDHNGIEYYIHWSDSLNSTYFIKYTESNDKTKNMNKELMKNIFFLVKMNKSPNCIPSATSILNGKDKSITFAGHNFMVPPKHIFYN